MAGRGRLHNREREMKRGRAQARARWQAVERGEFTQGTLLWLANLASAVLRADDTGDDNERRAAVLRAVQLSGLYDPQREIIRAVVRTVEHQFLKDDQGTYFDITGEKSRKLRRGERQARLRDAVADALDMHSKTEPALDKMIARALI